jgi:hypothetical protein
VQNYSFFFFFFERHAFLVSKKKKKEKKKQPSVPAFSILRLAHRTGVFGGCWTQVFCAKMMHKAFAHREKDAYAIRSRVAERKKERKKETRRNKGRRCTAPPPIPLLLELALDDTT